LKFKPPTTPPPEKIIITLAAAAALAATVHAVSQNDAGSAVGSGRFRGHAREVIAGNVGELRGLRSQFNISDGQRTLLTLLHLEEMPLAEIAGHPGISLANAKIKAFRARRTLRKILTSHGYSTTFQTFLAEPVPAGQNRVRARPRRPGRASPADPV
jgi:hypothetical protein